MNTNAQEWLCAGQVALEEYDFEAAEESLRQALRLESGNRHAAESLLGLLVDTLMADDRAVELESVMASTARRDSTVRLLLAIAHARRGNWRHAESLVAGLEHPRLIEVLLLCGRAALASGDWEDAQLIWQRTRQIDSSEPGVHDLGNEIEQRQTMARALAESELARLIEAQSPESVLKPLAQHLLKRFGAGAVAKDYLERLAHSRTKRVLDETLSLVDHARRSGDSAQAAQLLRTAASLAPDPVVQQELREAAHAAALEAERRAQEDQVLAVAELAERGELHAALVGYLALTPASREQVRILSDASVFSWLDALEPQGKKAEKAAVSAVLALSQAYGEVAPQPKQALARLEPYAGILRTLPEYRSIVVQARQVHDQFEQRRRRSTLDTVQRLLDDDDPEQAQALLSSLSAPSGDEVTAGTERGLWAAVQQRAQRHRTLRQLAAHEARSEYQSARNIVRQIIDESEPSELPAWNDKLEQLQQRLNAEWGLGSRPIAQDVPWAKYLDRSFLYTLDSISPRWIAPELSAIVLPITQGDAITVLLLADVTMRLQRVVTLRWPSSDHPEVRVRKKQLQVLGVRGERLDIELGQQTANIESYWPSPLLESVVAEDAVFSANADIACVEHRPADDIHARDRKSLLDVKRGTIRQVDMSGGVVEVLARETRYFAFDDVDEAWLCDLTGRPKRGWRLETHIHAATVHPSGEGIVYLRCDDESEKLELVEQRRNQTPRRQFVFDGQGEAHCSLSVLLRQQRLFVVFAGLEHHWLACYVVRDEGLVPDWRVPCPTTDSALLLTDSELEQAALLIANDPPRHIPLTDQPPRVEYTSEPDRRLELPDVRYFSCGRGHIDANVSSLVREICDKPPALLERWLEQREREGLRTSELVSWFHAASLEWRHALAGLVVLDRALRKRDNNPLVRLLRAEAAAHSECWAEVHRALITLECASLTAAQAQHVLHLRLLAALSHRNHDAARDLLRQATALDGACELGGFDDLLAPLDGFEQSVGVAALVPSSEYSEPALVAVRRALLAADRALESGEPRLALELLDDTGKQASSSTQMAARRAVARCAFEPENDEEWLARWLACARHLSVSKLRLTSALDYAEEAWSDEQLAQAVSRAQIGLGDRVATQADVSDAPHAEASADPITELARNWTSEAAPRLGHESLEQCLPALRPALQRIADSQRCKSDPNEPEFLESSDLAQNDALQQIVEQYVIRTAAKNTWYEDALRQCRTLIQHITYWVAFEQCHRKTFWVDEELALALAETRLDISGEVLRLPYPSCAFVFTDAHAQSLAAELVRLSEQNVRRRRIGIEHPGPPRVITVYVREARHDDSCSTLDLDLVLDPLAQGVLPWLVSRGLVVHASSDLDDILESHRRDAEERALDRVVSSAALQSLLHLTLNAILYATSAECESRELAPSADSKPLSRRVRGGRSSGESLVFTGETVFYLPGRLSIHQVPRDPSDETNASTADDKPHREILKRFPVRGHWRRPPAAAQDQRLRWVRPHFRGPSMAVVIERQYRLTN